jgi:murein L,D-transpeptidase YcbB/YkuD
MKKFIFVFIFTILNLNANLYISKIQENKQKDLLKYNLSKHSNSEFSIKSYYLYNNYDLLWVENNKVKDIALQLIYKINDDETLKINRNSPFNLNRILKLYHRSLEDSPKLNVLIKLDIKLTILYHRYMSYLSKGVLKFDEFKKELNKLKNKKEIYAAWEQYSTNKNYRKLLYKSLLIDDLNVSFNEVDISFPKAKKLIGALSFYNKILKDGDFIQIPKTFNLTMGDISNTIGIIRSRLEQGKLLKQETCSNKNNCKNLYDMQMYEAIKKFQKNHGLHDDGIFGEKTRRALNLSAKKRIEIIRINLERMRWLPRTLGDKFILVNIPDYKLKFYNQNLIEFKTKIIVGKTTHPTPIFSNKLKYIVLNPYWKIPVRIVKKEIIPQVIKNPNYLKDNGIYIHESWSENSKKYNSDDIDWSEFENQDYKALKELKIPGKFIQESSNKNPLGKVKFMFPNKYSVYLHDTPAKNYFDSTKRAYSHGCIRIKEPQKLLENIATLDQNIDYDETQKALTDIQKEKMDLNRQIPVHIIYLTSWVNESNELQFRDDVYGYDKIKRNLLKKNKQL